MANTFYDSELTGAQIDKALKAIDGLIAPSNNGKIVTVRNGKLVAKSARDFGGDAVLEHLSVNVNGDYYPGTGVDGFDEVHVAVPNSYTAADEGKVVSSGALVAQTARSSPIVQNGTYDTTQNNAVTVNVPSGGATIQPLNVTQNGTYTAPSGVDGYSPVVVNVSGGGNVLSGNIPPSSDIGVDGDLYKYQLSPRSGINYVEYLEGTGTQYITSDFVSDAVNQDLILDYMKTENAQYVFGTSGFYYWNTSNSTRDEYKNSKGRFFLQTIALNTKYKYYFMYIDSSNENILDIAIRINSQNTRELYQQEKSSSIPNNKKVTLFGYYESENTQHPSKSRIYRCVILKNGVAVKDYMPALDPNNVPCMWENISGEYAYNNGSDTFLYGNQAVPEIKEIIYRKSNGIWYRLII